MGDVRSDWTEHQEARQPPARQTTGVRRLHTGGRLRCRDGSEYLERELEGRGGWATQEFL